jgi:hypothetical protein
MVWPPITCKENYTPLRLTHLRNKADSSHGPIFTFHEEQIKVVTRDAPESCAKQGFGFCQVFVGLPRVAPKSQVDCLVA